MIAEKWKMFCFRSPATLLYIAAKRTPLQQGGKKDVLSNMASNHFKPHTSSN